MTPEELGLVRFGYLVRGVAYRALASIPSAFTCERCGARPGQPCRTKTGGRSTYEHRSRYARVAELADRAVDDAVGALESYGLDVVARPSTL